MHGVDKSASNLPGSNTKAGDWDANIPIFTLSIPPPRVNVAYHIPSLYAHQMPQLIHRQDVPAAASSLRCI